MPQRPVILTIGVLLSGLAARSEAQPEPKSETRMATVKEVEIKGRSKTLVVTGDDGTEQSYVLTPRINFEVVGTGDAAFVVAGQFAEGKGVLSNDKLFVPELTVHLLGPGKRPPAGRIAKAPMMPGESVNAWTFSGLILGREQDADSPEYQRLTVKIAGRVPPIFLEKDFKVNVVSHDPVHAKSGMPVELELLPLRGGRFNLLRATVKPPEPFQAEELLKSRPGEK